MLSKDEYASAPYNFISFPEKIMYRHSINSYFEEIDKEKSEELQKNGINELPPHDKFQSKLKSGYIEYAVTAKSPLFISNGNGEFFSINNECVIPGSTMRGKIRSNAEILSSSYPEFIKNSRLWYRGAFSGDVLKDMYKTFLLPNENSEINDKVKAGYLINKNGKYKIIPAKEDNDHKTFRSIHEKDLAKCKIVNENNKIVSFMYSLKYMGNVDKDSWDEFEKLKNDKKKILKARKEEIGNKKDEDLTKDEKVFKSETDKKIIEIDKEIKRMLTSNQESSFEPYYCNIKYDINENNELRITDVKKFTGDNTLGILMSSSRMKNSNKQHHYIIYSQNLDGNIKDVNENVKNSFQTSVKLQNNVSNKFHLPEDNRMIPVFYILDNQNEVSSFGFTPYLKIAYEKSVFGGIKVDKNFPTYRGKELRNECLDYVQSIFGVANFKYKEDGNKKFSYKGRVSFSNAKLSDDNKLKDEIHKSLMSPKISSFQLYLKQDKNDKNNLKTYSEDFELRGQKFYWLKNKADEVDDYDKAIKKANCKNKAKPKMEQFSKLKCVNDGTQFVGKIYFENLYNDELGLLLMSIKPFENAMDNIGQGKSYGFGKIEFNITDINLINTRDMFKKFNIEKHNELSACQVNAEINKYKDYFREFVKNKLGCDLFENERIKSFYMSKYKNQIPNDNEINYMELEDNRFKERRILKPMNNYVKDYYENIIETEKLVATDNDEGKMDYYAKRLSSKYNVKRQKK